MGSGISGSGLMYRNPSPYSREEALLPRAAEGGHREGGQQCETRM